MEDFAQRVNAYCHQYIGAADAKAGSVLLVALPAIGLLLQAGGSGAAQQATRWLAVAALGLGVLAALVVLYPRRSAKRQGYIYWADIAQFGSQETYVKALGELDAKAIVRAYQEQNYALSTILCQKYRFLRWSIVLVALGLAAAAVRLVL